MSRKILSSAIGWAVFEGLLLAMQIRHERDMDEGKVVVSDAELELTHGFDKGGGFNVAYCSSKLRGYKMEKLECDDCRDRDVRRLTSTIQTSGSSPDSSTGILETRSIQSWIAFVTCGTI